jgi:hypothetical protein
MTSPVRVTLRNPLNRRDLFDYWIEPQDHELARDWIQALKNLLASGKLLEKNFCFVGFPDTPRTVEYLCQELNQHCQTVNDFFDDYLIEETFTAANVLARDYADHGPNHELFNQLHNHFERLQGTVDGLSNYYRRADYATKYAIRQLNNICHELESLLLSRRKAVSAPEWIRPSQITTWLTADRLPLKAEHRQLFAVNGYDRVLGGVYMHWTQIGKTLFEVFRDEGAPTLTSTVCEAITHLQYYSGEFDVEWGRDVVYGGNSPWHDQQQDQFCNWLIANNLDPKDTNLSLGYLPLAQVDLQRSFGTTDSTIVWKILTDHLDIYQIEVDGVVQTFDYCWTDPNYQQQQIDLLRPGYDYSSRIRNAVAN